MDDRTTYRHRFHEGTICPLQPKNVCLEKTAFEVMVILKSLAGRLFAIISLNFLHIRKVEILNHTNLFPILSITV